MRLDHPCYFRDPWSGWEKQLPDHTASVILLGTGLTMVDAFLTLNALGWEGKIHAVSRNGLLPLSHFKGADYPVFLKAIPSNLNLDQVLAMIETHYAPAEPLNLNPAILVDKLRPYTQRHAGRTSRSREKGRFIQASSARGWNVVRHRVPEAVHRELMTAVDTGHLEIVKGGVRELTACDGGLRVVAVDGAGGVRTLQGGAVVNCTGPAEGFAAGGSALYRNLLGRGLVVSDGLDLGIQVATDFVALERDGGHSRHLLAVGPPLKGVLWETTAVPELRNQAFRIAEVIVTDLHAKRAAVRAVPETYSDVLEYSI